MNTKVSIPAKGRFAKRERRKVRKPPRDCCIWMPRGIGANHFHHRHEDRFRGFARLPRAFFESRLRLPTAGGWAFAHRSTICRRLYVCCYENGFAFASTRFIDARAGEIGPSECQSDRWWTATALRLLVVAHHSAKSELIADSVAWFTSGEVPVRYAFACWEVWFRGLTPPTVWRGAHHAEKLPQRRSARFARLRGW